MAGAIAVFILVSAPIIIGIVLLVPAIAGTMFPQRDTCVDFSVGFQGCFDTNSGHRDNVNTVGFLIAGVVAVPIASFVSKGVHKTIRGGARMVQGKDPDLERPAPELLDG